MKKLTPLFLSAAALVALSPEVANAQGNPVDPEAKIENSGVEDGRTELRPQVPQEAATPSTDVVQEVKPVTTDDQIVEVEERREQDVTAAVLDESSIEVDQVYHTPVQVEDADADVRTEDTEKRYEYTPDGDRITDRDKNEVQVRFDVNDQSKLVNKQGQATDQESDRVVLGSTATAGKDNFRLVNRNDFGPKTIKLSDFNGDDLFTRYNVTEQELEDGTFEYSFDLAFNIPNNSISTVYDLIGTFIDENNNTIDRVISAINVVHQDAYVEIRDERTHPDVDAYQPDEDVVVPFQRVLKYVQHDEDVYVANGAFGDYQRGDVIHPDDVEEAGANATVYNLNLGERITVQNGVNGSKTIFYKEEFVDGDSVTGVIEDRFRTDRDGYADDVPAINQIVLVGSVITNVDRVSGVDRFQNAVQLSRHGWNDNNDENIERLQSEWGEYGSHVFIANADKYADSLTGTPLAAANGAPILLTRGNTLNGAVATELARLYDLFVDYADEDAVNFGVTILGGTDSISEDVATAISTALLNDDGTNADTYEIDRIGGIDRYHQAYLVAEELVRIKEEEDVEDNVIYIASGDTFSDALAIAAQAGEYRNPVLLTRGNTLNEYARTFLDNHISDATLADVNNANVTIVGGPSTISQNVATQINAILAEKVANAAANEGSQEFAGGDVNQEYYTNPLDFTPKPVTVDRISGANRYAVSRNVNADATYTVNETGVEAAYTHYLVVSGDHPSDALPASALANQLGYGVLLVSNNTQRAQEQLIAAIENGVTDFTFIGGVNTLSQATFNIFNYTGDTIRAIIEGPEDFSSVINEDFWSDLLDEEDSAL